MRTDPTPTGPAANPEVKYEKTDATVRPLYQFLFWISVTTLLTAVLSGLVLRGLELWRKQASQKAVMAEAQDSQQPPTPRLQINEPKDLAAFKREEAEILSTYGIVDREKGMFRIPIEQAMKLTLDRGLLVAADPSATDLSPKPATLATGKAPRP